MKTLFRLFAVLLLAAFMLPAASAQIIWRGGSPGQETEWNTPGNWSQQRVPCADDIVIIPNTGGKYDPVISHASATIYYLEVQGGAALHIRPNGSLVIDGSTSREDGILLVGELRNEGEINFSRQASHYFAGHPENVYSTGNITYIKDEPQDQ